MEKIILLFLTVVLFACTHQSETGKNVIQNEEMFPFGGDTLVWKKIEKQNDSLKNRFVKTPPKEFENEYRAYNDPDNPSHSLDDLKKDLHVYDFNNDGKDDLIFWGLSGGEPKEVAFILNIAEGMKVVFKDVQEIQNFEIKEHKISAIYMYDNGCCAAYLGFSKIYHVDYSKDLPQFNLTYLSANLHVCDFPKSYYKKPIEFEVLNDNYKLRYQPKINDTATTYIEGEVYKGNTIGLLSKGAKGRAIGEEKDKTGRKWWLVELDPETKIKKGLFYEPQDIKKISSKMGWISSRYVKVLN